MTWGIGSLCPEDLQRVNLSKSKLYVSPNIEQPLLGMLKRESGFEVCTDLGIYLGIPLLHKPVEKSTFDLLLQCINERLSGWRRRLLSLAGRVTLAKSAIGSLLVYSMVTLMLPKSIRGKIDQATWASIWGSWGTNRKMHMVKWSEFSKPKELGSLGVNHMEELNLALNGKLAWRFLHSPDDL
ncbi:hypothetical protein V2J09_006040 [Rumex salicifolius]